MADRPARTYTTGPVTRLFRYTSLASAGVLAGYVAFTYQALPDTVPTHFTFSGEADNWGPKWTIWVLLGVNVVMTVLLAWLSTKPRWFNYVSEITDQNAQFMYREGERMMVGLSLAVTVVFWGATLSIYEIENPFVVLGLIALPVLTITGLIRMSMAAGQTAEPDSGRETGFKSLNW